MNKTLAGPNPTTNADNLAVALAFMSQLITAANKGQAAEVSDWPELGYFHDGSPFGQFIGGRDITFDEYAILTLALLPHLRPEFLENALRAPLAKAGDFPEIGGWRDPESRTFIPTGQTAAYLLAGQDIEARFAVQRILSSDHWFAQHGVLRMEPAARGAPILSGRITMSPDWIGRLTLGEVKPPSFSPEFPAHLLTTDLNWDDLVVRETTAEALDHIKAWILHAHDLRETWFDKGRFPPGFRALFYGPSGTGKTLAATLLGQSTQRSVYRIDLSAVVSKYIGETEKNLARVFEAAENRNWILFFDEADALFGKRTNVKDSNDRYANQEVSYLLQRIETSNALCILATNLRTNIDDAFLWRFSSVVQFSEPNRDERADMWRRAIGSDHLPDAVIVKLLEYELTGGAIMNIVQFAAIHAISKGRKAMTLADVELSIQREIEKEGKVFRSLNT